MNWFERLTRAIGGDPEAQDVLERSGLSRRSFLKGALLGTAIAATVDIEQLLWTPGERTIWTPNYLTLTPDWFARDYLTILENNLRLTRLVNREYGEPWTIGDTMQIGVPARFRVPAVDPQTRALAEPPRHVTMYLERFL